MIQQALVYDADCGFCTRAASWIAGGGKVQIVPWQKLEDLSKYGLTESLCSQAAYWVENGDAAEVAEGAIARALIVRGSGHALLGQLILLRPIRLVARPVYRLIARNRHAMPGGTDSCRLPQ